MSLFTTRLKQLRTERGENQEAIANYLGLTRSSYSAYERGVAIPPYNKILMLAERFGVTVEYLMGHSNNPTKKEDEDREFPDIMRQLSELSDELMNESVGVLLNGRLMTRSEKLKLLSLVNSCCDMAELIDQNHSIRN